MTSSRALTLRRAFHLSAVRLSAANPDAWAYRAGGSRDGRIDLVRGFLVFAMVVDHLGGNSLLNALSGNNQFLASAAEGFVFVSGLLMGIVYFRRIARSGFPEAVAAILRRAFALYVTVTTLTLAFVGLYLFTDLPLWFDRSYGLGVDSPILAVAETLRLRYTYNGTDILVVYVLLVALAPLAFLALRKRLTLPLLAASWSLWALYLLAPDRAALPWPFDNSLSFPLAAWQALFTTGLVLGYQRGNLARFLGQLRAWWAVLGLGVVFLGMIGLAGLAREGRLGDLGLAGLNEASFGWLFDKASLGPGRVIAFFLLAGFAYQLVTLLWKPLVGALGWLLLPLGRNSLLAYGLHLALLGPTRALLGDALYGQSPLASSLAQLALLLVLAGLIQLKPQLTGAVARVAAARGAALLPRARPLAFSTSRSAASESIGRAVSRPVRAG